jgi:hypothetical protein
MRGVTARWAAALPLVLLVGCSEELDGSDLAQKVKEKAGARAEAVSCPDDIEVDVGRRFTCTMTERGGRKVVIPVTITNDEGQLRVTVPPP